MHWWSDIIVALNYFLSLMQARPLVVGIMFSSEISKYGMRVITIIAIVNYSSTATGYSVLLSCMVYEMQLATTEVQLL